MAKRFPFVAALVALLAPVPLALAFGAVRQSGMVWEIHLLGSGLMAYHHGFIGTLGFLAAGAAVTAATVSSLSVMGAAYSLEFALIGPGHVAVVSLFIGLLAGRLHRAKSRLEELAVRDELTGLYNHRYFQERLQAEVSRAERTRATVAVVMLDIDHFKHFNDLHGHLAGDRILRQVADLARTHLRGGDVACRYGGEELALILPGAECEGAQAVADRVRSAIAATPMPGGPDQPDGAITVSAGVAVYPAHARQPNDLIRLADLALYKAKADGRNRTVVYHSTLDRLPTWANLSEADQDLLDSLKTLVGMASARDSYTFDHAMRVAAWAQALARELQLPEPEVELLTYAGFLHDVGKIDVDRRILRRPGALSPADWEVMKRHPLLSAERVKPLRALHPVLPAIRHHHERFDGSGYPLGLKGEDIPLGARILAVAESYDAMVSLRPHRAALTGEQARQELVSQAGKQFDPAVVDAFMSVLDREREIIAS